MWEHSFREISQYHLDRFCGNFCWSEHPTEWKRIREKKPNNNKKNIVLTLCYHQIHDKRLPFLPHFIFDMQLKHHYKTQFPKENFPSHFAVLLDAAAGRPAGDESHLRVCFILCLFGFLHFGYIRVPVVLQWSSCAEASVNMFGYECFLNIVLFSERFLCVLMKMKYQLCKIACIRGLPSSPRNQYKNWKNVQIILVYDRNRRNTL